MLLFDSLEPALLKGTFDAAFTGLIRMPDRPVGVATSTLWFFWTGVYTGRDDLDVSSIKNTDRDHMVAFMVAHPGCIILSTEGGPSQETAEKIVADVVAAGGKASSVTGTVTDLIKAANEKTVHFIVGDAIALSDLAMKPGLDLVNLNVSLRDGNEWMAPMTRLDP